MSKDYLANFVLVGGTALALQLGDRKSVDLDFFTLHDFESGSLLDSLQKDFDIQVNAQTPKALISRIDQVKADFIHFRHQHIRPIIEEQGVRMLSVEDIAPMKLDAIAGRGSKKDFFDIFFLLKRMSLNDMFSLYLEKYPHQTTFHVLRSLSYYADAEEQPDPIVFDEKLDWNEVKRAISEEIRKI